MHIEIFMGEKTSSLVFALSIYIYMYSCKGKRGIN